MQNPFVKTEPADDPASLAAELTDARVEYIEKRNDVVNRATQRVNAVNELIAEHEAERDELREVLNSIQSV